MADQRKITGVELSEQFIDCPECGYDKGFHSGFIKEVDNGHAKWLLVCPSCGASYDIGLMAAIK